MERREFLLEAGKAIPMIAGAVYILGCSSSPSNSGGGPNPTPTPNVLRVTSSVDDGHSHQVTVPDADFNAGVDRTYGSTSNSGHTHSVTLTAAELTMIGNGGAVTATSSASGGHTHTFTFQR